jgi:hypothetical protein
MHIERVGAGQCVPEHFGRWAKLPVHETNGQSTKPKVTGSNPVGRASAKAGKPHHGAERRAPCHPTTLRAGSENWALVRDKTIAQPSRGLQICSHLRAWRRPKLSRSCATALTRMRQWRQLPRRTLLCMESGGLSRRSRCSLREYDGAQLRHRAVNTHEGDRIWP